MRSWIKIACAGCLLLLVSYDGVCQIRLMRRAKQAYQFPTGFEINRTKKSFLPGLYPDKQRIFKSSSPYRMNSSNSSSFAGDPYWVGSVTQQSYNGGKIGRYYYWDLQGNLRDSYLFVDIAGKNKRGLKLVFPRSRALF